MRIRLALILFVAPTWTAPALMPPRPADTSRTPIVVERIEVPVPVDDKAAEVLQMQLAAAVAAVLAAAVTKARLRRRYDHPAVSTVIDITDGAVTLNNPAVASTKAHGPDASSTVSAWSRSLRP